MLCISISCRLQTLQTRLLDSDGVSKITDSLYCPDNLDRPDSLDCPDSLDFPDSLDCPNSLDCPYSLDCPDKFFILP